ncbi:MAG: TIGR00299 family protein, partial [Candidatus Eisenbacteria bacterium]|nr:TIGR00299 family protein [Candidatus Eisenbacteria bacterium]
AEVQTRMGWVRLKIATLPDGTERAVPEFESVRSVAEQAGATIAEVAAEALAAHRAGTGPLR